MLSLILMAALQDHPWKDFPEGSSVTLRTRREHDGKVVSSEEMTYTRGATEGDQIRLTLRRGTEDAGEQMFPLGPPRDGFRDIAVKSKSKEKLRIDKSSYDCEVEELMANTEGGSWTMKVWYCPKVFVPTHLRHLDPFFTKSIFRKAVQSANWMRFPFLHAGRCSAKYLIFPSRMRRLRVAGAAAT